MNDCPFYELTEFTANLTHLEEFRTHVTYFESVQTIGSFMKSHETLRKAHFSTSGAHRRPQVQTLRNSLENEWEYEEFKKFAELYVEYNFLFTKKNSTVLQ